MNTFDQRHRPGYHFLPAANWMNDPNGLLYHKGLYHLFYQLNPYGAYHGTIHWGHAASRDMITWEHWPIALVPTPGGPDSDGCYSGCAVDNHGIPTLIYTGVRPECQCIAESHDGMKTFGKPNVNPVIPTPPSGLETTGFRDPCVWAEEGHWRMIVGSGIKEQGGVILTYTSSDLWNWKYEGQLCTGRADETGTMWECPDLFDLGKTQMLVFSPIPLRQVYCMTGKLENGCFCPKYLYPVDSGHSFYAPQTLETPDGRRVMWGWLRESRNRDAQIAAGWSGAMSLPREVGLDSKGRPTWRVAREAQQLRQESLFDGTLHLDKHTRRTLAESTSAEINLELLAKDLKTLLTVGVLASSDGTEQTLISWDGQGTVSLDTTHASMNPAAEKRLVSTTIELDRDEPLKLTIYIDASIIEVFVNERYALTERAYPTHECSTIWIASGGHKLTLNNIQCWSLKETGV